MRDHLMIGLRRARATMKMYAPNTTHARGANMKKYKQAEATVYRLGSEIDALAEKTMKMKESSLSPKRKAKPKPKATAKSKYIVPDDDEESVGIGGIGGGGGGGGDDEDETDDQIKERKGIGKLDVDAVSAFVIFEYSESMARCLEDSEKYSTFPFNLFRPSVGLFFKISFIVFIMLFLSE